jgi:hypothetical protein
VQKLLKAIGLFQRDGTLKTFEKSKRRFASAHAKPKDEES